ncbi:MAG: tape measure protein, partial [Candidatus Heimdallarchaeaceae archaeon]
MIGGLGQSIAAGATIAVTIKAIDKFSNEFRKASTAVEKFSTFGKGALLGFAGGMAALGVSAVKAGAQFEQTQVAFTTMLGSAEEADKFLRDLAEFAKKTPFTLPGVERSARQLMAVGFEAKDVIPILKDVGDIAAGLGLGEEGLQRLILNLGQVRNQGKLTGRELRDFAVAGVPLLDELAKQLGVTTQEVQDMVSKGEISTDMVLQAFRSMTSEGGQFADLMAKQAETVQGKFSNLQDTLELMMRSIGEALIPIVSQLADIFLNNVLPSIKPLIPVIGNFLAKALKQIVDIITPLLPDLIEMTGQLLELASIIMDILLPALEMVMPVLRTLINILSKIFSWISKIAEKVRESIVGKVVGKAIELATAGWRDIRRRVVGDAIIRPN